MSAGAPDHHRFMDGHQWHLTDADSDQWLGDGDDEYVPCPGMGVDDLCAQAHGLDPAVDGCGLCTIGASA